MLEVRSLIEDVKKNLAARACTALDAQKNEPKSKNIVVLRVILWVWC